MPGRSVTRPHAPERFEAAALYPVMQAREILARWRDAVAGAPDAVTSEAAFGTFPAGPEIPEALHGAPFLLVAAGHAGPAAEARAALAPLRALATPMADASAVAAYVQAQRAPDPPSAAGRRCYRTGLHMDALDDVAIDLVTERALQAASPHSRTVLRRSEPFHLSIDATWDDPAHDTLNVLWAREFLDAILRIGVLSGS